MRRLQRRYCPKLDASMAVAICSSPLSSYQAAPTWGVSPGLVRKIRRGDKWAAFTREVRHGRA